MEKSIKVRAGAVINNTHLEADNYSKLYDPGNLNELVGEVALGSKQDVDKAVQAAHKAFQTWKTTPADQRAQYLLKAAEVIEKEAQGDLPSLLVKEHGGMLWEAETDFYLGNGVLQYYSSIAEDFMKSEQSEDDASWISVEKVPKGVVGAIVPWNMPIILTMMKLGPALATGNTIVVKPSPTAPLALTLLLEKIANVLPSGVVNVVNGETEAGSSLVDHPLVKKVAFTGGASTGKIVAESAAQHFKSFTLELGGNDPAIILDDADVNEIMPKLLKGIFTRSGQICFAVKRIYVPNHMLDSFYETLCQHVDELTVGHGLDSKASYGPLNNKKQYDLVNDLIEQTKKTSAEIKVLGKKLDDDNWNNGYYILPHVVKDKDANSPIVSCEQFGPVIPVVPYDSIEEVIDQANDFEYGLGSSIWSSDFDRALEISRSIEAGSTFINSHSFDSLSLGMPFGGVKNSGLGRELGGAATLSAYIDYHSIRAVK